MLLPRPTFPEVGLFNRRNIMSYEKLKQHIGHKLTVFNYGLGAEFTVECEDCNSVLYTEGRPNLSIEVKHDGNNIEVDFYFRKDDQAYSNFFYLLQKDGDGVLITDYADANNLKEYYIESDDPSKVALTILNKDLELNSVVNELNLESKFKQEVNKLIKEYLV